MSRRSNQSTCDRVDPKYPEGAHHGDAVSDSFGHFEWAKDLASVTESFIVTELEFAFFTKSLRQICESEAIAKGALGERAAAKLKRRLADMRAAASVKELVAGRPREVEGGRRPCFAVDLCDGSHIVFCANHHTTPLLASGGVDWSKVSRVKILRIE